MTMSFVYETCSHFYRYFSGKSITTSIELNAYVCHILIQQWETFQMYVCLYVLWMSEQGAGEMIPHWWMLMKFSGLCLEELKLK